MNLKINSSHRVFVFIFLFPKLIKHWKIEKKHWLNTKYVLFWVMKHFLQPEARQSDRSRRFRFETILFFFVRCKHCTINFMIYFQRQCEHKKYSFVFHFSLWVYIHIYIYICIHPYRWMCNRDAGTLINWLILCVKVLNVLAFSAVVVYFETNCVIRDGHGQECHVSGNK